MNRSKPWVIVVVVLLLINSAALAMLWFKRPPQGPPPGGNAKDFLVKELKLTPDQQKQFDGLRARHQEKMKDIMDGMKDLKDGLFEKIKSPQADSGAVNSIAQQISEIEKQRDLATFYHFRSVRAILTPEQQTRFDEVLKDVLRMMSGPQRPQGPPPRGEDDRRPPRDSGEMGPPPGEGPPR